MAWTVHRMHEDHGPAFGEAVKRLASAIADSVDGSIPEGILRASGRGAAPMEVRFTDWPSARGGTRVRGVLTRSAVGPVTVQFRGQAAAPRTVRLAFSEQPLQVRHDPATATLTVRIPTIAIHDTLLVE